MMEESRCQRKALKARKYVAVRISAAAPVKAVLEAMRVEVKRQSRSQAA